MQKIIALILPFTFVACTLAEDGETYTDAELARARAAIPQAQRLQSSAPAPTGNPGALTIAGSSELAALSAAAVTEINAPAEAMIAVLEAIVEQPPTHYDATTKEFVWGPWDNEEGVGEVLVYIREEAPGADFAYGYAFARTMDGDLETAVPVIWGAATPDESDPDSGVGVTLWDIDANNAFDDLHDPSIDPATRVEQGKVVMLYGSGTEAGAEYLYNLAVLRDFRPDDAEPDAEPFDSDYFYGRVVDGEDTVDFLDWEFDYDVCDASADTCWEAQTVADAAELFSLRAAFFGTAGRGEATISEGDLPAPLAVVECWDEMLDTSYFSVDDGTNVTTEGTCDGALALSLAESGVPTLDAVDPALMAALTCVAEQGVEACD